MYSTRRTIRRLTASMVIAAAAALACGGSGSAGAGEERNSYDLDPQLVFWQSLQDLCGQAFEGRLVESVPPDDAFENRRIVMHVRSCDVAEIRIPFVIGEDRSRTWVITTTATGLRLKHDHRHEDGTEDEVSRYGGDTVGPGSATAQDFRADSYTAQLVPQTAGNIWTIEIEPGESFAYALRREGSDRRFRVAFDLSQPVPPPDAPW